MSKTRTEKIENYDLQIAKLLEQRKKELQKHRQEENKATNKRHCKRGAVMEKALPDLISITDEQFNTFVKKALATDHSKNLLAKLAAQNNADPKPENAEQPKPNPQPQEQANSQTVSTANHSEN
jgi:hypothetical protein